MMHRLRVPGALYRRAQTRADAEDTDLQTVLVDALTRYADGAPSTIQQLASMGGHARAATRDPADYAAMGRAGAKKRWGHG